MSLNLWWITRPTLTAPILIYSNKFSKTLNTVNQRPVNCGSKVNLLQRRFNDSTFLTIQEWIQTFWIMSWITSWITSESTSFYHWENTDCEKPEYSEIGFSPVSRNETFSFLAKVKKSCKIKPSYYIHFRHPNGIPSTRRISTFKALT